MKTTSHHTNDEQPDDHENPLRADGARETFDPDLGARVLDRDAADPNPAVVVALPDEPAYERTIDALDGNPSVADLNTDYPASGPVATVAYAGDLDAALDVWREASPDALAAICAEYDVRTYDFPTARLRPADEFSTAGEAGGDAE